MTSLYPGLLFSSTGLNRKLTPGSQTGTALKRVPFNDYPWPKNSPVSAVYDICNSSTRLIILNNKFSRRSKGSRLRGQTDIEGDIVKPEPERHKTPNPARTKCQYHQQCFMSDPEKFVAVTPGRVTPSPSGIRRAQDHSLKLNNGSSVNPLHHINCQGSMGDDIAEKPKTSRHLKSRASFRENRTLTEILNGGNLSQGDKFYLNSIIKVYSVDDLRQRKQMQYYQLLWDVISKGGYQFQDLVKYSKYLNKPHKTKVRPSSVQQERSTSALGSKRNEWSKTDEAEPRPQTARVGLRRTRLSSRNLTDELTHSKQKKNTETFVTDQQGYKKPAQKGKENLNELPEQSASGESLLNVMLKMSAPFSSSDEHKTKTEQEILSQKQQVSEQESN